MSTSFILRVQCTDQPGIVASVATCLRDNGGNIVEASQFEDVFSGVFFMRVQFTLSCTLNDFIDSFKGVALHFQMEWTVHPLEQPVRTLILVSKQAHCLNDLLFKQKIGYLPLNITGIVSNHLDAKPLARHFGHEFTHIPVTKDTKAHSEQALANMIEKTGAELIVLARYMQILSDDFCARYPGRVINIHHSFLPSFKGARPYHQAYERGVKLIGATAHFVTKDLDEGPIIEQETVRVSHRDTPDKMRKMGEDVETLVLSRAVQKYAERRVFLNGQRTVVL